MGTEKSSISSLTLTRIMVVLLMCIAAILAYDRHQKSTTLDRLTQRAHWLYPYVPKLDRFFDFQVDYYGLTFIGNTAEDYEMIYALPAEKPEIFFLRDAMVALNPTSGVFVDVGAHVGQHAMFLSGSAEQVIAFEPYPPVLKRLQHLVELNALHNVVIRPVGLGAEDAELPFFAPDGGAEATGSFVQEFSDDNTPYETLPIRVGDAELNALGISSSTLIKVDVEGFERDVLKGLRKTLNTQRPVVMMEVLTDASHPHRFTSQADIESVLPPDYLIYEFVVYEVYSGEYRLEPFQFKRHAAKGLPLEIASNNIVAIPKEHLDAVPKEGPVVTGPVVRPEAPKPAPPVAADPPTDASSAPNAEPTSDDAVPTDAPAAP